MSFPAYSQYKDSGVEWLGEVPKHWEVKPLKYGTTCNDSVLPDSTTDDYEIEYIEISDVDSIVGITGNTTYNFSDAPSRARRVVKHGDVLVSTVRTYLRAIAPVISPAENLIVSTGFAVIRPKKELLIGEYLGYLLRAEWWISEVIARSVGVSYPAINASDLIGLDVPLPSLQEQTQIARFLNYETARIDALIEEQQRLIELLKEKRQAVISHAVTKGLDPNVPMKDSGVEWLGQVPAHWNINRLGQNIRTRKGFAFSASDFSDAGVPIVKASDIKNFSINEPRTFISKEFLNKAANAVLKKNNILLSTVGSTPDVKNSAVGQIGRVPEHLDGALLNQNTVIFEPTRNTVTPEYLFFTLLTTAYRDHLDLHAHGTANQASLNLSDMLNFWIPIPDIEEQKKISTQLFHELEKLTALERDSESLVELLIERRSALISAAVTGKIDVQGWQPPAGGAPADATQGAN